MYSSTAICRKYFNGLAKIPDTEYITTSLKSLLCKLRSQTFFSWAHAINAIISTLWAEPKSKIVSGTLTWSLRTGGHLVMLIICFQHSWLIAEATRLMQVQCDWHFDSVIASQLGIHKQRVHLKYRHPVNYFYFIHQKCAASLSFYYTHCLLDKDPEHVLHVCKQQEYMPVVSLKTQAFCLEVCGLMH